MRSSGINLKCLWDKGFYNAIITIPCKILSWPFLMSSPLPPYDYYTVLNWLLFYLDDSFLLNFIISLENSRWTIAISAVYLPALALHIFVNTRGSNCTTGDWYASSSPFAIISSGMSGTSCHRPLPNHKPFLGFKKNLFVNINLLQKLYGHAYFWIYSLILKLSIHVTSTTKSNICSHYIVINYRACL